MIRLLIRLFVKDSDNVKSPAVRRAYGTLCSASGIILNLLLFAFKLLVGTLSGAVSIRADAINNLSDAGSSIVSLFGFKLSGKPADREHPFGHARFEYIAAMVVSLLILFIGYETGKGAVEKLLSPVLPELTAITFVVLALSILMKFWMFLFNRTVGKRIDSQVMRATALDSLSDAGATLAVLIAMLLSRVLPEHIALFIDPVMGLLVSVLIFVAGFRSLGETKNSILGTAPTKETVDAIRAVVAEYPEALGIHDLVVHQYGPGHTVASLHVEVDGNKDVFQTHDTIDLIERRLKENLGINCTIHLDPIVVDDPRVNEWRERVAAYAKEIHAEITIHDFRMVPGTTHTNLIFDMAVPFEITEDDTALKRRMAELIGAEAPNYFAVIQIDRV